ncbi:MAG: hypothetical protein QM690_05195 [Sphingobium sp.]
MLAGMKHIDGSRIAMGVAVGIAVGMALDNLVAGIGIGIALAVAMSVKPRRTRPPQGEREG